MVKHKRKRSDTNFVAIPVSATITLATLADVTVLAQALTGLTQEVNLISCDLTWSLTNATGGEGPLIVGLSHGIYTVAQILEFIQASPTNKSDLIAMERAKRKIRQVGNFVVNASDEVMNDSKPIRTKLRFDLDEGAELDAWVFNRSGATLTTGALIRINGTIYARWK